MSKIDVNRVYVCPVCGGDSRIVTAYRPYIQCQSCRSRSDEVPVIGFLSHCTHWLKKKYDMLSKGVYKFDNLDERHREFVEFIIDNDGDCHQLNCGQCPFRECSKYYNNVYDSREIKGKKMLEVAQSYIAQINAKRRTYMWEFDDVLNVIVRELKDIIKE